MDSTANANISELLALIDVKIGKIIFLVNTTEKEMNPQDSTKFDKICVKLQEIFNIKSTLKVCALGFCV